MTTSLDAYRSDREQLLARVRELEAEVDRLDAKLALSKETAPLKFLHRCPMCETTKRNDDPVPDEKYVTWNGWTYPKIRRGFWHWLFCRNKRPHFHQRCTACGARWVVDAEGWRFD